MDLAEYVRVLRAHKLLVFACVVVCTGIAAALAWTRTPLYAAHTQFFVSTRASAPGDIYQGSLFSQQRIQSYAQLVSSPPVLLQVNKELNLGYYGGKLASEIRATVPANTVLIDVTVTDRVPARSQAIAQSLGTHFAAFVEDLETGRDGAASPVKVAVTSPPELPASPVSPNKRVYLLLGVTFGLLLGIVAAVLREVQLASRRRRSASAPAPVAVTAPRVAVTPSPSPKAVATLSLDADRDKSIANGAPSTVRDIADVRAIVDVPVLGSVSEDNGRLPDPESSSWWSRAESYRPVESKLRAVALDRGLRAFVVTSAVEEEGKTVVAATLGMVMAHAGYSVILVDANVRNPTLSRLLGMTSDIGLTEVLARHVDPEGALQRWPGAGGVGDRLRVLPAGRRVDVASLRQSVSLLSTLALLGDRADVVIVDTPSLIPTADAVYLTGGSVGAILVTRTGHTRRAELEAATESLRAASAPIVGIVLNEPAPAPVA